MLAVIVACIIAGSLLAPSLADAGSCSLNAGVDPAEQAFSREPFSNGGQTTISGIRDLPDGGAWVPSPTNPPLLNPISDGGGLGERGNPGIVGDHPIEPLVNPEPGTLLLVGSGLAALGLRARKRKAIVS